MYCDLVGPCLQPAFRPCFLGCVSNRSCLENSIGDEVSPHLHLCITVGVLSVLIFYFIIWLLEGSLPTSLYWYFPAPDVTLRMVHDFILSPCALVLVHRGSAWKIACEIDSVPWYEVVVLATFHLNIAKYIKRHQQWASTWLCNPLSPSPTGHGIAPDRYFI